MCNCFGLARTYDETPKGFSPSLHHPRCEHYKTNVYAKISHCDGSTVILEKSEEQEFINSEIENGSNPEEFKIVPIELTADQFQNIPEFSGF